MIAAVENYPSPGSLAVRLTASVRESTICHSLRFSVRRLRRAMMIFMVLVGASLASAADLTPPALDWVLSVFTKEGFRSMTARGSKARETGDHQFEVTDLNLTLFSGDASLRVEKIILSPAATFLSLDRIARGEKFVRFIGDDIEATGRRWVYFDKEKKISLDGDVRVTFGAELKNLLK